MYAQIGIHGTLFLPEATTLAIHAPTLHFVEGNVAALSNNATVYLSPETQWENADQQKHLDTRVATSGKSDFTFPLGHDATYHPLVIHQADGAAVSARFVFAPHTATDFETDLEAIAPFYWDIQSEAHFDISLTWNSQSALNKLTNDLEAIALVAWDGIQWKVLPAEVRAIDLLHAAPSTLVVGSLTSAQGVDFSRYEALTIGRIKTDTDLGISEAFSPNGDGNNDVWYLHNAERYPQLKLRVFNRWGQKVYESLNGYNNRWDGRYKNKSERLPSTSYFYQIDTDGDGNVDHQGWVYIHY